jgi:hypothetical protein
MWKNRLSLQAGDALTTFLCTEDTLIGNLWEFLGSPAEIVNIDFIVDGCDVGDIQVTADFTALSTFQFTCINDGRIIGLGGDGGNGGHDLGDHGNVGGPGGDGGSALSGAAGWTINVDIDDGFLMGGGGGGGGGSYQFIVPLPGGEGDPGCGGGGAAGFSVTTGGTQGNAQGIGPGASPGLDGGPGGPGAGGVHNQFGDKTDGGNGGNFGAAGDSGMASDIMNDVGTLFLYGGRGGRGGRAFVPNGATLVFNGTATESELRIAERLKGETTEVAVFFNGANKLYDIFSVSGASTIGWTWQNDGQLVRRNSQEGDADQFRYWIRDAPEASFGDAYEVRIRDRTPSEDQQGSWDTEPVAQGTFIDLTSDRTWSWNSSAANEFRAALFEIRLASAPTNDIIDSVIIGIRDVN